MSMGLSLAGLYRETEAGKPQLVYQLHILVDRRLVLQEITMVRVSISHLPRRIDGVYDNNHGAEQG